jgi:DNA (cytosine-5)-methyltransferase 1
MIALDLFSGIGGMSMALRALGYQVARAYDSWPAAVAMYNHMACREVAVVTDLLSEEGRQRVAADCHEIGDVEILVAGPPCQGYSIMRHGSQPGAATHNHALAVIPDYVALVRPRLVLIENVPGLLVHYGGQTLAGFLARLAQPAAQLQYRVAYHVYDTALYGVPQTRHRVLILGVRDGRERLPDPGPNLAPLFRAIRYQRAIRGDATLMAAHEALRDPEDRTLVTAAQALSDLPHVSAGAPDVERPYATEPCTAYQHWMRAGALEDVVCDTGTPAVWNHNIERFRRTPQGRSAGTWSRHRLHPDAPARTLLSPYDSTWHYTEPRPLSVREYARLQGLPDSMVFRGTIPRRKAYRAIANSVPPSLIERVLGEARS